jgi:O-acetylhomoserine (thiol)-lyase
MVAVPNIWYAHPATTTSNTPPATQYFRSMARSPQLIHQNQLWSHPQSMTSSFVHRLQATTQAKPLHQRHRYSIFGTMSKVDHSSKPDFSGFHTRAIHAGARPDPYTGSRAMPIHQTTSYVFEDSDAAAAYFNLQEYGNTYSRIMNPTVAAFEERVANLEGGVGAVAFASGLAAQNAALFTLLEPGDHIVCSRALYGGTVTQFKHLLRKFSVALDFVDPDSPQAWADASRDNTKLYFGETIGNPSGNVLDIAALAALAHERDIPLMIDNTFATPYLCRPFEWGADIVVHSATKFMGGHGTSIGGVVVESGEFDWSNGRFPVIAEPSPAYHGLKFHETFGTFGYLMKLRAETLRDLGAAMAPFNAFLIAQGIETLPLRMRQHVANAHQIAEFLCEHDKVTAVHYPGLTTSRYADLVKKYLPLGPGAVFCFDLAGGREAGVTFIERLSLFSHLANVGDAKSLVIHPATTTHRQLSDEELAGAGIGPGTIRLSIGIEDANDLLSDLTYALDGVPDA